MSRIQSFALYRAQTRLEKPLSDATHTLTEISFLVVRLHTDRGVVGEAYLLSFQYSPRAIVGALHDAGARVVGTPVHETGRLFQTVNHDTEYFGQEGLNRWAQAAFNVAQWDAWCKTLGQPIWKVLGTHAHRVPIYGSGGWLSYSEKELLEEVTGYRKRGFRAVKIKVGKPDWREDLERLRKVREAVGPRVDIMMDANQGMDVSTALQLAQAAQSLQIRWFEEPIDHTNFQGYQTLKAQAGVSLAMGEREFSPLPLRELVQRNALDIWQPDLLRIGGVEAWRQSAALAQSFQVPVLPHFYKDYDVPLLCTIPNGVGAESFDWIDPLIDHPLVIQDGMATPHDRPGWGFNFKDESLTEVG
ncbi:L-alanine-DL-glutamate epimerase [Catalinimonas alkaloidigena]|uniref:L-alanine-DL-glutamate epimerase n=1 Tax=Catalinimonas alkaloidigena TaxID=1075417 RepID=A0A1G9GEC0_9BACT|nr:mandelate racemase/muconate lactonizing enzyme family protein [Catalinimonas alkaloidigena]SDK99056.1 L-alanine-DL-glutamate epimerase [Catalinimonas alkaloidigena]